MGKYFGTDGFRGEANVTLTVEHAFKVGRFLGWYYGQEHKPRIVIGKDTRRSSYMFEYALVAGLTASGADAYLLHVTTTPSVSYVVRTDEFDCGIMISASHNPFYDNGIKVINGMGCKLEAEVEAKIEAYIDGESGELPLATKENIGRTVDYVAGRTRYIGYDIINGKGSTEFGIGAACADICKAIFHDEKRVIPASVLLEGEYGIDGVACGVPCVIGRNGIEDIIELELNDKEKEQMAHTCSVIKDYCERAEKVK